MHLLINVFKQTFVLPVTDLFTRGFNTAVLFQSLTSLPHRMPQVSTARLVLASANLRKLRHSSAGTANCRRASTIVSAKTMQRNKPKLNAKVWFLWCSETRHGVDSKWSRSGGKNSAQKNKYFKAGVGQYLNPLKAGPSCQRKINSLLFPGLTKDPGLSERSKLGRPVAGVPMVEGGRLCWWLMPPDMSPGLCGVVGETIEGTWMPGMRGVSGEGVAGVANSRSTRWRSFSSSWRRIISSKALNCSCSRCRRCISATRSRSASSARCLDCSRAKASSSAFCAYSKKFSRQSLFVKNRMCDFLIMRLYQSH